jgi:hypothetical protein
MLNSFAEADSWASIIDTDDIIENRLSTRTIVLAGFILQSQVPNFRFDSS